MTIKLLPSAITVHCADSKNGQRVDISEIRKWHLARGFKDIGYHLVIQPDGEVQHGRGLNEVGAHVLDANIYNGGVNVGICLVGKDKFTAQQFGALRSQMDGLFLTYHAIPQWEIHCHNQFPSAIKQGKSCPNMEINKLLYWYACHDEKAIAPYLLTQGGGN